MSKIIGRAIVITGGGKAVPSASTTAQSGVTYTDGLSGLEPADISLIAQTISNNSQITNATMVVYYDDKKIHRKISVADQITIPLNGTDYAFDVIGFNHDGLSNSIAYGSSTATGNAGITFQMHDCFATAYTMNSSNTNVGGWKSSVMRTSTMVTMKVYLPTEWKTAIKMVNKVSGVGGGPSIDTETVSDSCFLLSEIEIFDSMATHSAPEEGTQYAYYKAGNSKVKKIGSYVGWWWERSPYLKNSNYFCCVDESGNANFYRAAPDSYGVAFAFCI